MVDGRWEPPSHLLHGEGQHPIPHDHLVWNLMALNRGREDHERLHLEDNVASNEYLMLSGDQFSTSRKHAVWLPTFLERYDGHHQVPLDGEHADSMTDFTWREYVDKVNNELIGTYANYVNRVLTLVARASDAGSNLSWALGLEGYPEFRTFIEGKISGSMESMERQRFKEALRKVMDIAQEGNGFLQRAEPWKYLKSDLPSDREKPSNPYQPHGTASGCSRYSLIHSCHSSPRGYGG